MFTIFTTVWGIFNFVFRCWIMSLFWTWFIVSQFDVALPHLSALVFMGIYLLAQLLRASSMVSDEQIKRLRERTDTNIITNLAIITFWQLLVLGLGAFIHNLIKIYN